jgi:hypothetical protein
MAPLTGPLADALRRGRQTFNAKFAAATKAERPIDADEFQHHLAVTLDPIVRSVAVEFAEKTDAVVDALFDLSLELFAQNLLGAKAKYPAIPDVWSNLLPRIPRLVARDPGRVAGAITNALYNLSRTPGTKPQDWRNAQCLLACQTVDELLDCGAVLAWRCGMPQYRQGALDKAGALTPRLAAQALGLPPNTQAERIADILRNLANNPWLLPQGALGSATRQMKMVGKAGDFRGFGGPFLAPPGVHCIAGELIAIDGDSTWRLHSDIYNALLLRCEVAASKPLAGAAEIKSNGTLRWQGLERQFPELAQATSIASTKDTVAVTLADSHHLYLVGIS